jgi:hypothetical protein
VVNRFKMIIMLLLCNVWGSLNYLIILRGLQEIKDLFVRVCSVIKLKKKKYGKNQRCGFKARRSSKVTNQGGDF